MTLHEKFERYIKTLEVIYSLENNINKPASRLLESSFISESDSRSMNLHDEQCPAYNLEELTSELAEIRKTLRRLQTEIFTILKQLNLNTVKLQVDDLLYLVAPVDRFSMDSTTGKIFKKAGSINYRLIL